jgi:hypothetical protein
MPIPVNVDNFVRAETARMFDAGMATAGGVNRWAHNRVPTPLDAQNVIRMNRDTFYSSALVNISNGASVTLPNAAGRYITMMVVNEDHFINRTFHDPGTYDLRVDEFDTEFVALVLRTLVDPGDAKDVAAVNALQDAVSVDAASAKPYEHPDYDEESRKATFDGLVTLGKGLPSTDRMFGRKEEVDPVRHLVGTAIAWGGLPETEAYYYVLSEPRTTGRFTITLKDVPVDGFWSLTIYSRDGFLEENPYDSYSINNLTAVADEDGSVTVNLAPEGEGLPNHLYIMDGWNYTLRLYRPRGEVLDGTWTPPTPQPLA